VNCEFEIDEQLAEAVRPDDFNHAHLN